MTTWTVLYEKHFFSGALKGMKVPCLAKFSDATSYQRCLAWLHEKGLRKEILTKSTFKISNCQVTIEDEVKL